MNNDLTQDLIMLTSVSDATTRNAIALRLAEARHPEALAALLMLIEKPELINCRATLVHCLGFYDFSDHFDLLIDLVVNGNWEVAHEAHGLLSSIDEISGDQMSKTFEHIDNLIHQGGEEEWRQYLLQDILSMFE